MDELDVEYADRHAHEGPARARRWYWRQVLSTDVVRLWWRYRSRAASGPSDAKTPTQAAGRLWPELLRLELVQAMRALGRRPLASGGFVGLLALSVATAAVVLSIVDGVLLRPPPYPDPGSVVLVGPRWLDGRPAGGHVSAAEYVDVVQRSTSFAVVGAIERVEETWVGGGHPIELPGARVTASALQALAVPPALGRSFSAEESRPGGPDVILLSHVLWRDALGANPAVVGSSVALGDHRYEVVGVMPRDFVLPTEIGRPDPSSFFVPLVVDAAAPGPHFVKNLDAMVGRLRPGMSQGSARQDVEAIAARIVREHPDNYRADEWTLRAYAPLEEAVGHTRSTLGLLLAAVGFLTLAASANLAGMLASRAEEKRESIAVRAALGAGRAHLVRAVLLEALLLAAVGGIAGVALASAAMAFVPATLADSLPRLGALELDARIAAVAVGCAIGATLTFGLFPALRATTPHTLSGLGSGLRTAARRARFRRALIGSQLAIASVLLFGGLLVGRSLMRLVRVDPGFEPAGIVTMQISLPSARYPTPSEVDVFFERLVQELRSAPNVDGVGLARRRPMADRYGTWTAAIRDAGEPRRVDDAPPRWQVISGDYFSTMSVRLAAGRFPSESELGGAASVAIVNRAYERRYWPDRSAVGTAVRMDGGRDNPWLTVVGVVEDVMIAGPRAPTEPVLYVPQRHFAGATSQGAIRTMALLIRTTQPAASVQDLVRDRVGLLDPQLPVGPARPMREIVAAAYADTRLLSQVLGIFALLTLSLGAFGVYSALAQEVSTRAKEIGVRAALGAGRRRIVGEVVREGVVIAGAAVTVGLLVAYAGGGVLGSYLFGIDPKDPVTFLAVGGVLLASAALAAYVPARHAASADPAATLRTE